MIDIKIIGKKCVYFCGAIVLCFGLQASGGQKARIVLFITDTQGREIRQATVGVPVVVKTVISGTSDQLPEPIIKGIENMPQSATQSGISVNTMNGVTTIKKEYSKVVRFDEEGTFTIGPAIVQGHSLESETKTLVVSAQAAVDPVQKKEAFITLAAQKTNLFFGEPLYATLTFFYSDDTLRIEGIEKPTLENADMQSTEGPLSGQAEIDGVMYSTVQWKFTFSPRATGNFVMGAVRGSYVVQSVRQGRSSFFDMFNSMMSGMSAKQIYSNGLKISIEPLPDYDVPVSLVGNFTQARLSLAKSEVKQSEGVSATLTLVGNGNASYIKHPDLKLPDQLTMYEGDMRTTPAGKYEYGYVLQGLTAGHYTIASQDIPYFDPVQKQYKILKTDPIEVTILAVQQEAGSVVKKDQKNEEKSLQEDVLHNKNNDLIMNVFINAPWQSATKKQISWILFFCILLIALCAGMGLFVYNYMLFIRLKNAPERAYKNAFKNARETFNRARLHYYDGLLYHMFIAVFAARKKIAVNQVTEDMMEKALYDAGIAEKEIVQWRLLFAQLAESAFTAHKEDYNRDAFFNKARYWLHEWEKIL